MALTGPGPVWTVPSGRGASGRGAVLALRALGLGDALTAVPALRGLRRRFPHRPLLLAAAGPPAGLLHALGVVDGVVPTNGLDAPPPGTGLGPHLAVNLHGRGPESHRLLLAGEPAGILAFACPGAGVAGPDWTGDRGADEHEVLRWCRLVATLGPAAQAAADDLRLVPPADAPSAGTPPAAAGAVVVHPGAASGSRRWPASRFAAVARELAGSRDVVVTGSGGEARLVRRIVRSAGLPPTSDLAGRLDLPQLARLLAGAGLLVCGDTGVAHLATALGTPSVLLFGPTPPARWGPLVDPGRHVVLWRPSPGDAPGDPHGERPDRALLRIGVPDVLAAAASLGGTTAPWTSWSGSPTSVGGSPTSSTG